MKKVVDVEAQVEAEAWSHVFGFIKSSVLVCAAELDISDILENHGDPMSLSELSSATGCPPEPLFRLMRFLIFHGIFQKTESDCYAQTPVSSFLVNDKLGAFMLLQGSPLTRSPTALTAEGLKSGRTPLYLRLMEGDDDSWSDPAYVSHIQVFADAMTAHTRVTTAAIIENYPEVFDGIGSVVDVGGRHGAALGNLGDAFPWVQGIMVAAPTREGVEFIGGNMFESVPKADAVMLMWILHDWNDEACIELLKNCKEAIPKDIGKVMIVEAIIDEDGEGDDFAGPRLSLDMIMLEVTAQGKERSLKEWAHLINEAGFSKYIIKNINTIEYVIEAYP